MNFYNYANDNTSYASKFNIQERACYIACKLYTGENYLTYFNFLNFSNSSDEIYKQYESIFEED